MLPSPPRTGERDGVRGPGKLFSEILIQDTSENSPGDKKVRPKTGLFNFLINL